MCYLRQVKLEQQNRIYSNEALSGEKPRVLGALVDPPLIVDPPLVTDPSLAADPTSARHGPAARRGSTSARRGLDAVVTYDQEGSLWRHSNLCSLF